MVQTVLDALAAMVRGSRRCLWVWTYPVGWEDMFLSVIDPIKESAAILCATTLIPHAAVYAIVTPLSNLFGKSNEPF